MKSIKLIQYNKDEIDNIKKSVDSEMKQMIWAGPKYVFPITNKQIEERIQKGIEVFSVYSENEKGIIGYIELENIENENTGSIQSVLIYSEFRGKGYSNELIREIIEYGINQKKYKELRLRVFESNKIAKKCYESSGFQVFNEIIRKLDNGNSELKLYEMKYQNSK